MTYGRRRLPASNATTTWLPTSGRASSPWSPSAYGEQSVAQARTSRSPSWPSRRQPHLDGVERSTMSVTIAGTP